MSVASIKHTAVIVPNWNGKEYIKGCLVSLVKQTLPCEVVVVENGSTDGSVEYITSNYPTVTLLKQPSNLGFAEGVNQGIRYAMTNGFKYVALFNNDAMAEPNWLKNLVAQLEKNEKAGIVASKFLTSNNTVDSTGEFYSSWGLPFPRGRDGINLTTYDSETDVFGGSGGSSVYRVEMLKKIGLFDKDFFAYYEDVDISFRAQLNGWKVIYTPDAIAFHRTGSTSGKIKGFTTYQTIKNLPWVLWKNVPASLLPTIVPRFYLAYFSFILSALSRGQFVPVIKGVTVSIVLLPKKLIQRRSIQKNKLVSNEYISSIITWDLPPNATRLRKLRNKWWRLKGKNK